MTRATDSSDFSDSTAHAVEDARRARVTTAGDGEVAIVRLAGDHDLSTATLVREALKDVSDHRLVVLDVSPCTFVDSTVLGVLVAASRRTAEAGGRLVGVGAQGIVRNALRVTAMEDLLHDEAELEPPAQQLLTACRTAPTTD
jgi:anti-anti-sigma factor